MQPYEDYLSEAESRIRHVRETQGGQIAAAGRACADSIGNDKLVFTFGTGHGSFAALETFPRTGCPAGFRPIVETPIALFHHVLGDMGAPQYRFLHTREGYGSAILRAHQLDSGDTMLLFSHSGLNAVILDMAIETKKLGMTVIGVTSVPHSSSVSARHSSGNRLFEVADIVIDTGVPVGDANTYVDGVAHPVGPTSTVVASAISHAIIGATVQALAAKGKRDLHMMVNPNTVGADEAHAQNDRNYRELWRLLSAR